MIVFLSSVSQFYDGTPYLQIYRKAVDSPILSQPLEFASASGVPASCVSCPKKSYPLSAPEALRRACTCYGDEDKVRFKK
jgi:hypothetical protein